MNRLLNYSLFAVMALGAACTSSSGSQGTTTNNSYDREFRESTRSSNQNYAQGGQLEEEAEGDPILTVMLMALETGDVHPGEDYVLYTVVDKPRERNDVEYVWSVNNGSFAEVEEAERGRIETVIENEYATATPGASAGPPEIAPEEGEQPENGGLTTGSGGRPAAGGAAVAGSNPDYDPFASGGGSSKGNLPRDQKFLEGGEPFQDAEPIMDDGLNRDVKETPVGMDVPPDEVPVEADPGEGKQDEPAPEEPKKDDSDDEIGFVLEQRAVGGPTVAESDPGESTDDESDEVPTDDPGKSDEESETDDSTVTGDEILDIGEAAARVAGLSTQLQPTTTAENAGGGDIKLGSVDEAVLSGDGGNLLRYEYETWKEDGLEHRRRPLAGYGDVNESERITAEESYEGHVFVTDNPYVVWTPELPGETTIFVKVQYKDEDLTEPRGLPVSVRLRDPSVELSDEFPDIVREDEAVYLELAAENIPAFHKGLFTVQFDPIKLSFRDAELGEFFDDAPNATMYHAQPNKEIGRVLLAVDTGTQYIDLSGDGKLAYIKFKAKEDLADHAETGLMLVADTSARYVLNRDGENVLPLPVSNPPYRTETVMPPTQPGFDRGDNVPGSDAPAPAAAPAAQNRPAAPRLDSAGDPPVYRGAPPAAGEALPPGAVPTGPPGAEYGPVDSAPGAVVDAGGGGGTADPVEAPVNNPPTGAGTGAGTTSMVWLPDGPPRDYYRTVAADSSEDTWFKADLSGSGDMDSNEFDLNPGLAIFTYDFTGLGDAKVLLKNREGQERVVLSGIDLQGSRAFKIETPDTFHFNVIALGDWSIKAWQPTVGEVPTVNEFEGDYTAATVFTFLTPDPLVYSMRHEGLGDFRVVIRDWEGNPVHTLVNQTGTYDNYVEYTLPQQNVYLLDVYADGKWSILIE